MKSTKLSLLFLTYALAAGSLVSGTLVAVADSFDSATFYDPDNWFGYRSNTNIVFSSWENSITFSQVDKSSYLWTYFDPITLSVGDKLSFSGTFTFGKIASDGVFSVGLFNSGLCGKEEMVAHAYQSGTDVSSMRNYSEGKNAVSTATGGMTGVSANNKTAYLRTNSGSSTAFLSASSGAQQNSITFPSVFSAPAADAEYEVSLEILKTSVGLDFSVALGGGAPQVLSFETEISTFDLFGFRSPVAASGRGIVLSGASVAVASIPEPSALGLFLGIFSIAQATVFRRVRKHKNG